MSVTRETHAAQAAHALQRALHLARIALAFGRVERVTRHEDGARPETDTDHTVMLGLVACELAPAHLDRAKLAAFALVHDLAEVYAGDTPTLVISPEALAAKRAREDAARARLADELGDGSWITEHLAIYEAQEEPEARFVRLLDKVLPKLTHAFNGCAASRPLTDRAGFVEAHARQLQKLGEEYPEFPEALELLRLSMVYAESCWSPPEARTPPRAARVVPTAPDADAQAARDRALAEFMEVAAEDYRAWPTTAGEHREHVVRGRLRTGHFVAISFGTERPPAVPDFTPSPLEHD